MNLLISNNNSRSLVLPIVYRVLRIYLKFITFYGKKKKKNVRIAILV